MIGEGVGVVVLKRLAEAERDGDRILGVIEGWGVNQDGKTNGITAPNEDSQARLLQSVYQRFDIDPAGIQLIEAHGTGTVVGDPIEVSALSEVYREYTGDRGFCWLGSLKGNVGHLGAAAGAVATAHALPSSPMAASRSGFGSELASAGSTSESGDSGTPSSPTEVVSAKRPATFSSESSVAAMTLPVMREIRSNETVAESPAGCSPPAASRRRRSSRR